LDNTTWRILDVNANRLSEGLRTIEDIARVICEDFHVALQIKQLRHSTASAIKLLDRGSRLVARNTLADAGTQVTELTELERRDWQSIVVAACERSLQSLRCLEEFAKLVSADAARSIKQVRYQAYDVLAQSELRLIDRKNENAATLYVLIDCQLPIDSFANYVLALVHAGVDWIQVRDKTCDGHRLVQYSRAAVQMLSQTTALTIVNDRVDVALASGAAGVHLGQEDISPIDARRIAGPKLRIGVSTHSIEQALLAQEIGADYIGCGPTFPTTTKSFDAFPGLAFLKSVADKIEIPAFAIGGINEANLATVLKAGAKRIAVSSVVHSNADPLHVVKTMKRELLQHAQNSDA
jgi:thiamine-phosphate pyrophosphorylase